MAEAPADEEEFVRGMMRARNYFELKGGSFTSWRHKGITPVRKLLLGAVAVVAVAISLALGMTGFASTGGAQGAGASDGRLPSFKTVSIKLNEDAGCCAIYTSSKDRFVAIEPAMDMIRFAYGENRPLKPSQVLGGPDWMKTDVFSIDAELSKSLSGKFEPPLQLVGPALVYPPEVRQTDALKRVFRSLLINRFKLRVRHETKVLPVYELVLAKNGPKIAKDETADASCRMTDVGPDLPSVFVRGKGRWLDVKSCDFGTFAGVLSSIPELRSRVLVDNSGLHGRHSFKLHWIPEMPPGMPKSVEGGQRNHSAAPSEPSGPSLFTALREQLGLKVQSTTARVDTIAIEHIENPAKR